MPAYENAKNGDFALIHELQQILANPYDDQSEWVENITNQAAGVFHGWWGISLQLFIIGTVYKRQL